MEKRLARLRVRINPGQIHFLKFILEAYDGLAILSTLDRTLGLMELKYPEQLKTDLDALLESMSARLDLQRNVG
ncbi:DUF4911 domain-containing protein [Thiovibrio sp. JS02]